MGQRGDQFTEQERFVYDCYVLVRRLNGEPPTECSIQVADQLDLDACDVQEIVDRVREAQGRDPIDW